MKQIKNLPLSILGIGVFTAIARTPVLADVTTLYHGTYCQPSVDSINKVQYTEKAIYVAPSAGQTTVNIRPLAKVDKLSKSSVFICGFYKKL